LTLAERIVSVLKARPADQYTLHRATGVSLNQLLRAITQLQESKTIHVARYRKSKRTGLRVPVYSLHHVRTRRPDLQRLLAGVTSERLVEYNFVARNIRSLRSKSKILDVGAGHSGLAQELREQGKNWHVIGIDLDPTSDIAMDARFAGFRSGVFDQVICVSTLEHVGLDEGDSDGDSKVMREILRILKKRGRAIITVPYGVINSTILSHRVYTRTSLARLIRGFRVVKMSFYRYEFGRWARCSRAAADKPSRLAPPHFHSSVCVCLLLERR
jgi:2-polyprenyl-3-methyl-5-hydroxy-6-metoxy-1,4-benzoquinol methylase